MREAADALVEARAEIAALVRKADSPDALAATLKTWHPNSESWERLGDSIFVPAVMCDLAGQLMVRGSEARTIQLDAKDKPAFLDLPWADAIEEFKARGIVKPSELSTLLKDYAQRADKARQLMLQQVQVFVRSELEKSLTEGGTFKDFAARIEDGGAGLGITADDPAYLNCFPAETPITGAVVNAVFRRWYEGPMLEVVTNDGRKFSTTPNHPMLTSVGWRAASELCEGDNLVCNLGNQDPSVLRQDDVTAPPTSIAEVFDAGTLLSRVERMQGTGFDFHGDGADGDVDVVRATRALRVGNFAAIRYPLGKRLFTHTDPTTSAFCPVCGNLLMVTHSCGFCVLTPPDARALQSLADGAVTSAEQVGDGLSALTCAVPSDHLVDWQVVTRSLTAGLTTSSEEEPARSGHATARTSGRYPVVNSASTDAELRCDDPEAEAGDVQLDRVISVRVREFTGHVYNLSTTHGYYMVDGIVVGNCVFRTNIQSAYGAGRYRAMTDPDVMSDRPFVEYRTVGDARVRDSHAVLDGTVYAIDSDVWQRIAPPNGYACRCAMVTLTRDEASGRKVLGEVPKSYEPTPGFDSAPIAKVNAPTPKLAPALQQQPLAVPVSAPEPKPTFTVPRTGEQKGGVEQQIFGAQQSDAKLKELFGLDRAKLPTGYTSSINNVTEIADYTTAKGTRVTGNVKVEATIHDETGEQVGKIQRKYTKDGDKIVVEHSSFYLDEAIQGSGIGREIFNAQIDNYQKLGNISRVELTAADVGKYVWTKAGFEWADPADFAKVKGELSAMLESRFGPAVAEQLLKTVKVPSDISTLVVNGEKVGKNLLIAREDYIDMSQSPDKITRL